MASAYRTLWSPLSSRKLALMAALSFCTTARSSAMVFAARTLRMNCLTGGLARSEGQDMVWLQWRGLRELILTAPRTPEWK